MHPTSRFLRVLSLIFLAVISIQAQTPGQNSTPPLEVTMILQKQQVRFTAPGSVQELRLEVFDRTGELIHDSGVVSGAELIWPLRKADGQPVASGLYAYQLTIREANTDSPRTQRGHLIVDRGQDRDPRVDRIWITSQSPGGVGALADSAELSVAAGAESTIAGARIGDGRGDGNQGSGKVEVILAPNAPAAVVNGAGTAGRIAKWTAGDTIGNSILTETGGGNLGIGTTTPGSKLTVAGAIDTSAQYNIDGTRILANPGTNNLFAGAGAGTNNTTGNGNAFIGRNGGNNNTTGDWNSALGTAAGRNNTTGAGNTFVGFQAGLSNITQNNNTFIGYQANGAAGITNATAIGANASVTQSNSFVLGNTNVNVGIGVTAPSQKLHVAGQIYSSAGGFRFPDGTVQATAAAGGGGVSSVTASGPLASSGGSTPNISLTGVVPIANGGTGSATQNFVDLMTTQTINGTKSFSSAIVGNITGNAATVSNGVYTVGDQTIDGIKTFTNAINTDAQYNISGNRILSTPGNGNIYAGALAGIANTTGNQNAFFGNTAGQFNTTGVGNSFFGHAAGRSNTTGSGNSFFGDYVALANTGGGSNSFFGYGAGTSNTMGDYNSFFGRGAGIANTTGARNTFIGPSAGGSNTTENDNTFIGFEANGAPGINNATAIGVSASVTQSNSLVLGSFDVSVGIGVTSPSQKLHVAGQIYSSVGGFRFPDGTVQITAVTGGGGGVTSVTASGPLASSGGTTPNISLSGVVPIANGGTGSATQNFVDLTSAQMIGGAKTFSSTIVGNITGNAGMVTNGVYTTGDQAISGNKSFANALNTNSYYSINGSRVLSVSGADSTFIGINAGTNNIGNANSFFGYFAGYYNSNGRGNSFFGESAGAFNTTGDDNSFYGSSVGKFNTTGTNNAFFGKYAGLSNTTGNDNSFFGYGSGYSNITGAGNAFFGRNAGFSNTIGRRNTMIGISADFMNSGGSPIGIVGEENTFIGFQAGGPSTLTNATAIGANALVTASNSLVLGNSSVNIGIGVSAPVAKLDVRSGDAYLGSAGQGVILKSPDGTTCRKLTIDNAGALVLTTITCP